MCKRFVAIWFRHLKTDWLSRRQPDLLRIPFVLALPDHGRMIVTAVNSIGEMEGINPGMAVADARAIVPGLKVVDDKTEWSGRLLNSLARYCIRYSPYVAIDEPDGLIFDVSGCSHLWGGDPAFAAQLAKKYPATAAAGMLKNQ